MSRIAATFNFLAKHSKKAIVPFITAGDPSLEMTVQLMKTLVLGGADIIELGVPFSDPMADGPVIQRASERALKNGIGIIDVLKCVQIFRESDNKTPVVLMGYANPIERMGIEKFVSEAAKVGVDGVLIVDYPPEEATEFAACMKRYGLDVIFLLAPTSTEQRILQVSKIASGYVYYVSLKGVTGNNSIDLSEVNRMLPLIKQHVSIPIAVGFGIRDSATAKLISTVADGIVIGSRIIQDIELHTLNNDMPLMIESVQKFIQDVRETIDN